MRGQNKLNKVRKLFLFQSCWWCSCGAPNVHFPKKTSYSFLSASASASEAQAKQLPVSSLVIKSNHERSTKPATASYHKNELFHCLTCLTLCIFNFLSISKVLHHTHREDEHTNIAPSPGGGRERKSYHKLPARKRTAAAAKLAKLSSGVLLLTFYAINTYVTTSSSSSTVVSGGWF